MIPNILYTTVILKNSSLDHPEPFITPSHKLHPQFSEFWEVRGSTEKTDSEDQMQH